MYRGPIFEILVIEMYAALGCFIQNVAATRNRIIYISFLSKWNASTDLMHCSQQLFTLGLVMSIGVSMVAAILKIGTVSKYRIKKFSKYFILIQLENVFSNLSTSIPPTVKVFNLYQQPW